MKTNIVHTYIYIVQIQGVKLKQIYFMSYNVYTTISVEYILGFYAMFFPFFFFFFYDN